MILSQNKFTQVFFIPSKKLNFYIDNFKKFFSGRKILIAKEITKIHETFMREDINNLKRFKIPVKGELTVVISEKNSQNKNLDEKKIVNKIKKYLKNYSLKDTVNLILETEEINKKKVYELCLKVRNEKNS
jgi:16S rRNA (cytidine1402-2'-O)-methyltransferase